MDRALRFGGSEEYELLQPYADGDGLIAGYRIEGVLAMDPWRHTTYEATAPDGRRIALKVFRLQLGDSRREAKRFQRRIRARASLQHPNLLPIFDWGRLGDDHYYTSIGLTRAHTLADMLEAGQMKTKASLRLLGQLADALETAHEQGVIHRELAPANVLISPADGGQALLGDFGVGNPDRAGQLLDLVEPAEYTAPERLKDEPLTAASNVYTLACILVECLTGSPPFSAEIPGMVAYAHAAEPPPRLSARRSDLPAALDDVVAAAMAKDPEERIESPRRLITAAAHALGVEPALPPPRSPDRAQVLNGSSAKPAPAERRSVPETPTTVETSGLRRRLELPEIKPARGLILALIIAAIGAVAFLGRGSDDDARPARPAKSVDRAQPRARPEQASASRATEVALQRLAEPRSRAHQQLTSARTGRAQAVAAARLASAYRSASRSVPDRPGDTRRLVSSLTEAADAYGRLAARARARDRLGYAIAARAVNRAERDVQEATNALNRTRP